MWRRLSPYEAATLCGGGCNPTYSYDRFACVDDEAQHALGVAHRGAAHEDVRDGDGCHRARGIDEPLPLGVCRAQVQIAGELVGRRVGLLALDVAWLGLGLGLEVRVRVRVRVRGRGRGRGKGRVRVRCKFTTPG